MPHGGARPMLNAQQIRPGSAHAIACSRAAAARHVQYRDLLRKVVHAGPNTASTVIIAIFHAVTGGKPRQQH